MARSTQLILFAGDEVWSYMQRLALGSAISLESKYKFCITRGHTIVTLPLMKWQTSRLLEKEKKNKTLFNVLIFVHCTKNIAYLSLYLVHENIYIFTISQIKSEMWASFCVLFCPLSRHTLVFTREQTWKEKAEII